MRKIFLILLSLLTLPSVATAAIIDFSVLPENTPVTNQFAGLGVTFRGLENGSEVPIVVANFGSTTGDSYLSNCYPVRCADRADIVEVSFLSAVDNVSFGVDSEGGLSITFNAFDAGGNLLESFAASSNGGVFGFSADGISRIDMLQPTESWGWGFANLTFDAAASFAVPTPATLVLVGLGLVGLGRSRRKNA